MEKGIKSKRKILEIAFRLFAAYSYPDVSYSLLEEATGISRGSMVYYFSNKEGIFRAVLETFLFNTGNARSVSVRKRKTLTGFYNALVDNLAKEMAKLRQFNIRNLSDARFNIERSALQFIPEFRENERRIHEEDYEVWKEVVGNAIASGELKKRTDAEAVAKLFQQLCYGWLYSGVYNTAPTDEKIEELRRLLDDQYNIVCNKLVVGKLAQETTEATPEAGSEN